MAGSLVAASMLLASRRFGHTAAGVMVGLPMIAGPIIGVLLIDLALDLARAVALGTLVGLPAMALHYVVFAYAARRWPWAVCLLVANGAFVVAGTLLTQLPLPAAVSCVLAFANRWWLALRAACTASRRSSSPCMSRCRGSARGAAFVVASAAALATAAAVLQRVKAR